MYLWKTSKDFLFLLYSFHKKKKKKPKRLKTNIANIWSGVQFMIQTNYSDFSHYVCWQCKNRVFLSFLLVFTNDIIEIIQFLFLNNTVSGLSFLISNLLFKWRNIRLIWVENTNWTRNKSNLTYYKLLK